MTQEDIQKLMEVLATKEDVRDLKQDVDGLRESVQALTVSVDRLVKAVDNLKTEYGAISMQINRHEKWIQQLAEKLGIKLEH